jgi:rare lipoprotein A
VRRALLLLLVTALSYGCATTAVPPAAAPQPSEPLHGTASWYGQEFAGRTTANGEIFDPLLLTAAHRTLPFGTIVDVRNVKNNQTVRVRINDRGPFVEDRLIDLSYAAADRIGMVAEGKGEVDLAVVQLGRGDREPPAPYVVTIPPLTPSLNPSAGEAPTVDFPLPPGAPVNAAPTAAGTASSPATVAREGDFRVEVVEQRGSTAPETRKQIGPDGRTIVQVPVAPGESAEVSATTADETRRARPAPAARPRAPTGFAIQVGAFQQESNAEALRDHLMKLGQQSYVDKAGSLYRVRIGPFTTRDEAVKARQTLETQGISAMIVSQ